MQCEHGRFHQNCESCHVDYLPLAERHGGPHLGHIFVSTFHNEWRTLLRFDTGDVVRLASAPCPCGRAEGITLAGIEGRNVNLTFDAWGNAVTQAAIDQKISQISGIAQYAIVQMGHNDFRITIVPRKHRSLDETALIAALQAQYGKQSSIQLLYADRISPDHPGKYRLTKALFDFDHTTLRATGH